MTNISSGLKSINELLNYDFFIPYYQRGFRWDNNQVNDLLNDIYDFYKKKKLSENEFYCLQPIVVTPTDGKYTLIDGQQRLTTIYIIMAVLDEVMRMLGKTKFSLEYQTREDSEVFLKDIDYIKRDDNIDYFHMCQAKETIEDWFSKKDGGVKVNLLNTLLNEEGNNVRIIWYEVDSTIDPINLFTNLNMGKIPLTNAELIKALFLNRDNFIDEKNEKAKQLRQLEIASDWDRIEQTLREEEFWYFLQDDNNHYDNHIEIIFDLISENMVKRGTKEHYDKYYTFRFFHEKFKQKSDIEENWKEIKNYFQTFRDWFKNKELYHLIGFLITTDVSLKYLYEESKIHTKKEFKKFLIEAVKKQISSVKIEELTYQEDKSVLRNVLLLFNIVTILQNEKTNLRFQFGRYKNENWDIEHIHAVKSEMPTSRVEQLDWLRQVKDYTDDSDLLKQVTDYLETQAQDRKYDFEELYDLVIKKYSEEGRDEDINDISNLTLLDSGTNRGYKNAVFPIKRKTIIEKDETGTFIPLCTKNVFLKYYTRKLEQMSLLGKEDRMAYKTILVKTINDFLNLNNKTEE
ncbi:MAG: DUF262 domain-containing protein [Candidatus Marinimicrobia bacterium]|nr:DUF262 domain-containing protein [Candidatus Neomarinimicrobiota bacterium]